MVKTLHDVLELLLPAVLAVSALVALYAHFKWMENTMSWLSRNSQEIKTIYGHLIAVCERERFYLEKLQVAELEIAKLRRRDGTASAT